MNLRRTAGTVLVLLVVVAGLRAGDAADAKGWIELYNGKDTAGWRLRDDKIHVTKFVDGQGQEIPGAKKGKVGQKEVVLDARGKEIPGARVEIKGSKRFAVDEEGKAIAGAKVAKVGGREVVVNARGKEILGARVVTETVPNQSGWVVQDGVLACTKPHHGNDLVTTKRFRDFELHVEFQATGNSGVYLQGRYEIQVDNSFGAKPRTVVQDGQKVQVFDKHQCGAIYGRIAPSKNMALPPKEWQSFDVIFHGARGDKGKVTHKARVTLVWNGEKVIDDAEIDGPTGGALDGRVTAPGPLLLQGDHGRVAYRNLRIRPLSSR